MRILLVPPKNNYPLPEPQSDFGLGQGMPYLAGALKAAGHDVFGANIYHVWCHGSAPLTVEKMLRDAIEKYRPHLIGIGGLAAHYLFLRDAIFFCRSIAPEVPIVLGGGIVTYDAPVIFSDFQPDYAIVGEGEISIVKLVECLEKGKGLESVPSLVYKKNGTIVCNATQYPENLDELPFPDYSPFDFDSYLSLYNQGNNSFSYSRLRPRLLPITIGRSCPFKCTFCAKTAKYRTRSIDHVMKEIAYFYDKYQFNLLFVADELFSVKDGKVLEFCSKIKMLKKSLNADFGWSCHLRVNDVDQSLLKEMKEAGCVFVGYGFESASNAVLKSMKKGIVAEDILRAIRLSEEANIGVQANFIFGDIAETPETIQETLDFYRKHCRHLCVYFFYITPYPGSELYRHCRDRAILETPQKFYENLLNHRVVNMTRMSDDVFFELTKPIMTEQYACEMTRALSCERTSYESCDRNAPFELRRSFYKIEAMCPHCKNRILYLYPLRPEPAQPRLAPIFQYCVKCHKKIEIEISDRIEGNETEEDAYRRFYQEMPYLDHYQPRQNLGSVEMPHLLEAYKEFNIVRFAGFTYAIAQSLGDMNISKIDEGRVEAYQEKGLWFVGNSAFEVKKKIDANPAVRFAAYAPSLMRPHSARNFLKRLFFKILHLSNRDQ